MLQPKTIFLIVCSFMLCSVLRSQQNHLHNYTTADGLPQNTVTSIFQDNKGFMWFSTPDGLARFDGYDFKIWRANFKDSNALKSNSITGSVQDVNSQIWVCTSDGGLSKYNPITDEWRTFLLDSARNSPYSNSAYQPMIVGDTALWYLAGWSLQKVLINKDPPVFEHFILETNHELRSRFVMRDFDFDGDKTLWVASPIGMVAFDLKKEKFELAPGQNQYHLDSNILSCQFDHRGDLWVAPFKKPTGIIRKKNLRPGAVATANPYVPVEFGWLIVQIKKMPNGQMFVMSSQGLYACDYQNQSDKNVTFDKAKHLTKGLVWDATIDDMQNLWIGTESGLYCDFAAQGSFDAIKNVKVTDERANTTYRIFNDSQNKLWFGALNELQVFDKKKQQFTSFPINSASATNDVLFAGALEDVNQNLWIAAYPNLIKMDPQTGRRSNIKINLDVPLQFEDVSSFINDAAGDFWFGHSNGVTTFNPNTNTWRSYLHYENNYFSSIAALNDTQIACVARDFLYLLNKNTLTTEIVPWNASKPDSLAPYLRLSKMLILHQGYAFIGAKNGFFTYEFQSKKWHFYTTAHGLPSNVIRALAADTLGRIWMSTNHGIAYFDVSTQKISAFNPVNAIGCLEFNSRAVDVDQNGIIYFGCDQGVLRIDPIEFVPNKEIPPVEFTSFKVFNKEVPVGLNNGTQNFPQFTGAIEYAKSLVLNHDHSVFTIGFVALNYFEPAGVMYRHRLVGFEEEWLDDGTNHDLTYTNLDPGNYELQVKASNNFGNWGDTIYTLPIVVLPPWYATLWARISILILLALLLYLLFMWRIKMIRREEEVKLRINAARMQEREDFRKESAADFHDEAGNKITKINLFTELAHSEVNGNQSLIKYLTGIEQNIKALSAGMRDFLWVMDPDKDTLFDTIYRLQRFGDSMFNATKTKFHVRGLENEMQNIKLSMHARKVIIQIFKEGIHNCLKHADAPSVTLEVSLSDTNLHISLSDIGSGFSTHLKNKPNHYGVKIMRERAESIGARFEINSSKGAGSQIDVTAALPHLG